MVWLTVCGYSLWVIWILVGGWIYLWVLVLVTVVVDFGFYGVWVFMACGLRLLS